jgi:uncharacterized protein YecA (UPF0149 family)
MQEIIIKTLRKDYLVPLIDTIQETYKRDSPKIGRNEKCPCKSGKKYKKCCLGRNKNDF